MPRIFQENEIIGEYRIDGFLGAGGMGEVYRGVHLYLNRVAAIKVLSHLQPDSSFATRFYNEARLQSSLHHPNIATLYDFKNVDGRLCIFMEYVDGECLSDLIERQFFAVEEALRAFYAIAEAVAFVHCRGILHRDIKAQNIKLDFKGTVKLLDFGIAKDADSQKLTKTGSVIGTPSYLAPEQLAGKTADFQTDVWSLGVLLYEMLSGAKPFQGESLMEMWGKIKSGEYEPVERINPAVPREVARLVERCLKKDKRERYGNAAELAHDAAQVLASRYRTADSSASAGNAAQHESFREFNDFVEPSKKMKKRLTQVVLASSLGVLLIFAVIGASIWAMNGGVAGKGNSNISPTDILIVKNSDSAKKQQIATAATSVDSVEVRIDVIEGSAEVVRGGEILGKTPYALKGRIGEKINIKLRREGFRDYETQIEVSSGKKFYTFALQKK